MMANNKHTENQFLDKHIYTLGNVEILYWYFD